MIGDRPSLDVPPSKKRKIDHSFRQENPLDTDEPLFPFKLVPSPQEARALETIDVWVTTTFAAAGVAEILKFVQKKLTPLDIEKGASLTHLKRVRRTGAKTEEGVELVDIILCAASSISEDEFNHILKNAQENGILISPRVVKVSRWPAYNTRQLAEFKALWPVNLRKDTTRSIKNASKEAAEMKRFMLETIALSKENQKSSKNDLPITAIVVNPKTSEVLLTAHDTRLSSRHPLNHAVMNSLKQLPLLLPGDTTTAARHDLYPDEEEQYYAASYDVYITHEPCTMCCMALVHSRIRRLVFWRGMATGGRGLGWMKGDEEGTLNHRYMCFEGIEGALDHDTGVEELSRDVHA